jgi:hypothetical protein
LSHIYFFQNFKFGHTVTMESSCHFLPDIRYVIRYRINKTWLLSFFEDTLVTTSSIHLPGITSLYSEHKTLPTHKHQQHEVTCWAIHEATKFLIACKRRSNTAKPYCTWLPANCLISLQVTYLVLRKSVTLGLKVQNHHHKGGLLVLNLSWFILFYVSQSTDTNTAMFLP